MRKEARNEAEKWDWNQATLQLQNYYADTLKKQINTNLDYATCGGVGLLYEIKGSIKVAIF